MIDDTTSIGVRKINEYLQDFLKSSDVTRNLRWKLKNFEFSNMFSYGEDNSIDFSKLTGIVGLFAMNASGKSSLLDALTFCLYDKSSRAYRAKNVLNNKKEVFHCKAELEIDGKLFFIERKAKLIKRTQHVKVDVDFWTVDDAGEKISLNDEQRRTTDAKI
jgi:DNA repair exonuclease SbcCD ATPase subunit